MSDANRVRISYRDEVTYGVVDNSGPLTSLRFTGEDLETQMDTIVSNEIRADRQTADLIRNGLRTTGPVNFEYSHNTYNDWFRKALCSAAATAEVPTAPGVALTVDDTAGIVTITRPSGSWVTDGITTAMIGRWVRTAGFTNPLNNGTAKILNVSGAGNTILTVTHSTMVDETSGTGATVTVLADYTAGTSLIPFSFEREYQDLSTTLAAFKGQLIDTMEFGSGPNTIMTGSFGLLGKNETSETATIGNGTYTPSSATVTPVMNGIDNLLGFFEAGLAVPLYSFRLRLQNNLRERLQMGTLGPESIGAGEIGVTGECVMYFNASRVAQANKFLNFTNTNIVFKLRDNSGNLDIWDVPRMKFRTGKRSASGKNQDIFLPAQFTGFLHPTQLQSLRFAFDDA